MDLIEKYKLRYGRKLNDNGIITPCSYPIFNIATSNTAYNELFCQMTKSETTFKSCINSTDLELAKNGYSNDSLSMKLGLNLGFFQIKPKYEKNSSKQDNEDLVSNTNKEIYLSQYLLPRCSISMNSKSVELDKQFVSDLRKYQIDGSMEENVFRSRYGHHVISNAVFGGKIWSKTSIESDNNALKNKTKNDFQHAVGASVGVNLQVLGYGSHEIGGSYGTGNGDENVEKNQNQNDDMLMNLNTIGGDATAAKQNDFSVWKKTLKPENWDIIQIEETIPVETLPKYFEENKKRFNINLRDVFEMSDAKKIDINDIKLRHFDENTVKLNTKLNEFDDHNISINLSDKLPISFNDGIDNDIKSNNIVNLSKEWKVRLIEDNDLLCGRKFDSHGDVISTANPIFSLKPSSNEYRNHFKKSGGNRQNVDVMNDKSGKQLVKSGYSLKDKNIKGALDIKYGLLTAASIGGGYGKNDMKEDEIKEQNEIDSAIFIAQYRYPKGTIILNEDCLKLNELFVTDLTNYFLLKKMTEKELCDKYGYWVNMSVDIGGKVYSEENKSFTGNNTMEIEKKKFSDSWSAKINTCIDVNVDGSSISGTGIAAINQNKESQKIESMIFEAVGGDTDKISPTNFSKWIQSLAIVDNWSVIDIRETNHILNLDKFLEKDYPEIYESYKSFKANKEEFKTNINNTSQKNRIENKMENKIENKVENKIEKKLKSKLYFSLNHGGNLYFQGNTIRKIGFEGWSTFTLIPVISRAIAMKFNIDIKWTRCVSKFVMGYCTSLVPLSNIDSNAKTRGLLYNKLFENEEKNEQREMTQVLDWNDHLGKGENKKNTTGIWIGKNYKRFYEYNKNNYATQWKYKSNKKFQSGDIFSLSFDFQRNDVTISHNHAIANKIILNAPAITIAFSLFGFGDEIKIIKCSFVHDPSTSIGNTQILRCLCGAYLIGAHPALNIYCSICTNLCKQCIFRCPSGDISAHPRGFNLCHQCYTLQSNQSNTLNTSNKEILKSSSLNDSISIIIPDISKLNRQYFWEHILKPIFNAITVPYQPRQGGDHRQKIKQTTNNKQAVPRLIEFNIQSINNNNGDIPIEEIQKVEIVINTNDLYLNGFIAPNGVYYYFNDALIKQLSKKKSQQMPFPSTHKDETKFSKLKIYGAFERLYSLKQIDDKVFKALDLLSFFISESGRFFNLIGYDIGKALELNSELDINLKSYYLYIRNWDNLSTKIYHDEPFNDQNQWEHNINQVNKKVFETINFGISTAHSSTR